MLLTLAGSSQCYTDSEVAFVSSAVGWIGCFYVMPMLLYDYTLFFVAPQPDKKQLRQDWKHAMKGVPPSFPKDNRHIWVGDEMKHGYKTCCTLPAAAMCSQRQNTLKVVSCGFVHIYVYYLLFTMSGVATDILHRPC